MDRADLPEEIRRARGHVDALRLALQSPSQKDVDACFPCVEEAIQCLQAIGQGLAKHKEQLGIEGRQPDPAEPAAALENPDGQIRQQLRSLSNELDIAQRLVTQGAAFCEGWGRVLASHAMGYAPSGDPVPLEASGSVSLKA